MIFLPLNHLTIILYCTSAATIYFIYNLNMLIPTGKDESNLQSTSAGKASVRESKLPFGLPLHGERRCAGFSDFPHFRSSWESIDACQQPKSTRGLRGGFLGWVKTENFQGNEDGFLKGIDPEIGMSVEEIIRHHGYPVKTYQVITEDGYILSVQRIPYGKSGLGNSPRKPVLIVHCFLCSSAIWVVNTKDKNLPYILADSGYDVWLANIRGTSMGRRHIYLSPEEEDFWDFSFDEMAKYDIPAIVDVMLNATNFQQIFYIGHSIGTTIGFSMLASQPRFNNIFRTMFALAPAATADYMRSGFRHIVPYIGYFRSVLDFLTGGEFLTKSFRNFIKQFAWKFCNSPFSLKLCEATVFLFGGMAMDQVNKTRIPVYLHHTPDSSSVRNLLHGFQCVHASQLQQFDFGKDKNEIIYKQPTPPIYDLSKITGRIALFWGENDHLADPRDVQALSLKLKNLVGSFRVPLDDFAHMDFLWDIDIKSLVYDKILELMEETWPNEMDGTNGKCGV